MSSEDTGRPGEDRSEGVSKYFRRMKSVLRPRSAPRDQSLDTPNVAETAQSIASAPAPEQVQQPTIPEQPIIPDYKAMQREKAQALFSKYNLSFELTGERSPTDHQFARVAKPIRMRVRRACHRCETVFGPDKVCVNCQHLRCKKCPRFPPAQAQDEEPSISKIRLHELRAKQQGMLHLTPHLKLSGNPASPLSRTSNMGGPDFVNKPIRQRVRRDCHLCGIMFARGSKQCASCRHNRCKSCPRQPAKLDKYPDGYPGDVEPPKLAPDRTFKKPRRRVHYICHVCTTSYHEDARVCVQCGQTKCDETIRVPPKKIKQEPDPGVIRSLEEKLANMVISANPIT
ncbi:hypothetical protein PENANT_c027G02352 [Penicillium antarcticum]|uniref:Uncharacterized protein n=1 Tax=Penicillium antarcticum TaxID=416450 RepID=A0A1V6PWX1_9EURO|nr:uncharacterized protein N7508_003209 [Penicillium antarcticum]KAJ5312379.1 hypothetical protein N7508_003209 [Penicillium antarcticum]OQD81514.1 hypothetical protein PENANT_c027G02352 [Penicillium antarcticum]